MRPSETPTKQRSAVCFLMIKSFTVACIYAYCVNKTKKWMHVKNIFASKFRMLQLFMFLTELYRNEVQSYNHVLCFFAGSLLVQCSADGPSHLGWLCVPKMGPRSWLVHGPLLHDPHPRLHGLHVPQPQRHIQRGKNNNALKLNHGFPGWCNTGAVGFAQRCPFTWTESCTLHKTSWFSLEYKYQVSLFQTQWP